MYLDYGETGIRRSYEECVSNAGPSKRIVPSDDYTLQIDIDSEENFEIWKSNFSVLKKIITIKNVCIVESFSGLPHRHITIVLKYGYDIWKRIALQAILGSDLKRETLNMCRALTSSDYPIVFFEDIKTKEVYTDKRMLRLKVGA